MSEAQSHSDNEESDGVVVEKEEFREKAYIRLNNYRELTIEKNNSAIDVAMENAVPDNLNKSS